MVDPQGRQGAVDLVLPEPEGRRPSGLRLTQSLADIPGTTASGALVELSRDGDRAVALTAVYLLRLRDAR
jgi:hypothetical protein